ncbi:hypothetical protein GCM10022276_04870 [Sphingomonas limnosediminicola]|jgi:hypothetical protein|uniref:Uncharacterized protein n=1 Tax=Sphingomonas limnosediminicola TaxID=940133 RepID=A0ABP7KYI7_9SPHN
MSRAIYLSLDEGVVVIRCLSEAVSISTIESLPGGGVRVVCASSEGAERIRRKLHEYILDDDATRHRHRPTTPLW